MATPRTSVANKLLSGLSEADFKLLAPHLEAVDLPVRRQLEVRNRRIEQVYFPEQGVASMVISMGSNHAIEVCIIGKEGMTGLPVILQTDSGPHETFMQVGGRGWRMAAKDLRRAMETSEGLRRVLLQFTHTAFSQMAFNLLANGRYSVEERLARWLLMVSDRVESDTVSLTHEFLSVMLGARRPGVTVALNEFAKRGVLDVRRGEIAILDRKALEETANGGYGGAEAEYLRLFGARAL